MILIQTGTNCFLSFNHVLSVDINQQWEYLAFLLAPITCQESQYYMFPVSDYAICAFIDYTLYKIDFSWCSYIKCCDKQKQVKHNHILYL